MPLDSIDMPETYDEFRAQVFAKDRDGIPESERRLA